MSVKATCGLGPVKATLRVTGLRCGNVGAGRDGVRPLQPVSIVRQTGE